jgi:hypothetical protein
MTATLSRPILVLMLLALLAITVLTVMAHPLPQINVPVSPHAIAEHGADASLASLCLDGRDGYQFFNSSLGRWALVCWLGDRYGFVILDGKDMHEITAWVSDKYKTFGKVVEYMIRQGYVQQ